MCGCASSSKSKDVSNDAPKDVSNDASKDVTNDASEDVWIPQRVVWIQPEGWGRRMDLDQMAYDAEYERK